MEHQLLTTSKITGNCFDTLKDTLRSYRLDLSFPEPQSDAPLHWSIDAHPTSYLRFFKVKFDREWSLIHQGIRKSTAILSPMLGQLEVRIKQRHFIIEPDQTLLIPTDLPCQIRFLCDKEEHSLIAIDFSRHIVNKVLGESAFHALPAEFRCGGLVEQTQGIGTTLAMTIRSLTAGIGESGTLSHSPQAVKLLSESILHMIFASMAQQPERQMEARMSDITPRHLKVAIDFIHNNLHRPLSVSEIAEAAGVSVRALQAGFQRHHHTSPLRYLRQVRLEAVHRELSSPGNRLPIGEVAQKWGFNHLGRFSIEYRSLYGEPASATVKRAQLFSRMEA
ncbi:helix-turn-helix domain-containing protein [Billgrantia sp. Q4P2]|uniref:helix-turn-helix domain-containing protein n=1 Tax=Billgrantia sp. Q4P2 TaxID=3463857 RepID=UPI004056DDD9